MVSYQTAKNKKDCSILSMSNSNQLVAAEL